MSRLPFAVVLMAAASLDAQSPPCQLLNGATASVGAGLTANVPAAPNTFAFRLTLNLPGNPRRGLQISHR
jgi:hypothetical protein